VDETLCCSFCDKSQAVVGKLISSPQRTPRVYICDECIAVCNSILGDDVATEPGAGWTFAEPVQVLLEPDVALVFRDAASVNRALRELIGVAARIPKPDV
jgi:ATP-dependent protease Clp ATPase subunit